MTATWTAYGVKTNIRERLMYDKRENIYISIQCRGQRCHVWSEKAFTSQYLFIHAAFWCSVEKSFLQIKREREYQSPLGFCSSFKSVSNSALYLAGHILLDSSRADRCLCLRNIQTTSVQMSTDRFLCVSFRGSLFKWYGVQNIRQSASGVCFRWLLPLLFLTGRGNEVHFTPNRKCWSPPLPSASSRTAWRTRGTGGGPDDWNTCELYNDK